MSSSREPTGSESFSTATTPIIIGIFGVSGCGKSRLMNNIKIALGEYNFAYFEGSEVINKLVKGGLDSFKTLAQDEQYACRERAIEHIREKCVDSRKVGVVVGHYMFWSEDEVKGKVIWTESDQKIFTHIIYLHVPGDSTSVYRRGDKSREREEASPEHLEEWKNAEETALREICYDQKILFARLFPGLDERELLDRVVRLFHDFEWHSKEERNMAKAKSALDKALASGSSQLKHILVVDADKTLTSSDTGYLFWEDVCLNQLSWKKAWTPTEVFRSPLKYSYEAFLQARLLYQEAVNDAEFKELCQFVADQVEMYPEFISLLSQIGRYKHVGAVVVTSGLQLVWEKVLETEGLADVVQVVGMELNPEGLVVTADVKATLTARLRDFYALRISAFGDSQLDLGMLENAHEAIVVVGHEHIRSKSMEGKLQEAIEHHNLKARQVLLPSTVKPRLNTTSLPLVELTDPNFVESIFGQKIELIDATLENAAAARLLATPMRDATTHGPRLREKHEQSGWYLANEFLSKVIGIEECDIEHVLGHTDKGYRLMKEDKTMIVALMRGGEPMALGVSKAFPSAGFLHAHAADDIEPRHLKKRSSVILVDSVVNTGKSIAEYVERVLGLNAALPIFIVAGVVLKDSLSGNSALARLACKKHLTLVTLRTSETKFTGKGTTDTGNRLFNTTFLP
ncbi:MAG: hypothetical protein Q9165_007671 [Trypethelium subeluteriae]